MTDIRTPIGNLRPYHVYPLIVYLRDHYREMDDETRCALMAHVAMHSPDPAAVAALADIHEDAWGSLYPREDTVTPGTTDTIDKFIATYGHPSAEDDALLERLILNPTPDYGAVLADEDAESEETASGATDATAAGIEGFLGAHGVAEAVRAKVTAETAQSTTPAASTADAVSATAGENAAAETVPSESATAETVPSENATAETVPDASVDTEAVSPAPIAAAPVAETKMPAAPAKISGKDQTPASSLSESLAKIYIRQGRYRRAYEILSDLNLKNPEKSIYFADQLRFLRKVISLLPPEHEGEGGAR